MKTKTARVQPNGTSGRWLVIFEEKSAGCQIYLNIRHYASQKTAERAAEKYKAAN